MPTTRKPAAQAAEANDVPITVTFKDASYVVPAALDLPVEILEASNELEVLRAILGAEQYEAFRATKPTLRDLKDLGELVAEAAGFDDLGE